MKKIKNSIIGFLIALIALLTVSGAGVFTVTTSQTAHAASLSDLSFTELSDGTYSVNAANENISGDLVIPSTYNGKKVTQIAYGKVSSYSGNWGFQGCTSLKSVTVPDSVTFIANRSFYKCTSLERVTLPDSLTSLGYEDSIRSGSVFEGCTSLKYINLPKSLKTIDPNTFYDCTSLTSITIPDGVTSIGSHAFYKSGLQSVSIPDSVTSLESSAFGSCESLTDLVIGDGVQLILSFMFTFCTSLKTVTIGKGVNRIQYDAFYNCNSLEKVLYAGTSAEWENVQKGNRAIPSSATVVCLDD